MAEAEMGMRWARLIGIACIGIGLMLAAASIFAPPRLQPIKVNPELSVMKGGAKKLD